MAQYPILRPRRLRSSAARRALVQEHRLSPADFIQPFFVQDGEGPDEPIASMPGQFRLRVPTLVERCVEAWELGVPAVAFFPKIDDHHKSLDGAAAWDDEGLVPRAVRAIKQAVPELAVITDVALDPYSALGQDGIVRDGKILNDETIEALVQQAACHCLLYTSDAADE